MTCHLELKRAESAPTKTLVKRAQIHIVAFNRKEKALWIALVFFCPFFGGQNAKTT
jgi:hypothetical protein